MHVCEDAAAGTANNIWQEVDDQLLCMQASVTSGTLWLVAGSHQACPKRQ